MTERAGKVIHHRIPDDLHAQLAEYARLHDRSLTNSVVHLLRQALAAEPPAEDPTVHHR